MQRRVPRLGEMGDRFGEYQEACPAISNFLITRAKQIAEQLRTPEAEVAYVRGAAELIELLGTIAINREFEGITSDIPTNE